MCNVNYCPNCGTRLNLGDTSMYIEDEKPVSDVITEADEAKKVDVFADYTVETEKNEPISENGVKKAIPKVYNYRERYKKHLIFPSDVKVQQAILPKLERQDSELDGFNYQGERLFFGKGIVQDF